MSATTDVEKSKQSPAIEHHLSSASEQDAEIEPELHWKTWVTVCVACFPYFAMVSLFAAAGFWRSAAAADVGGQEIDLWVNQAFQVVNAVLGPTICRVSDLVGRKWIVVITSVLGTLGGFLMSGATSMNMIIAGSTLFGFYWASLGALSSIASEVLPRRHRGTAQLLFQTFGTCGVPLATIGGGALIQNNPGGYAGWRSTWWMCSALVGLSAVIFFVGYNPPPTPNPQNRSLVDRLLDFDRIGSLLFGVGLCLFMMGLIWGGGGAYLWTSKQVLSTLIIGAGLLVIFGLYEKFGTKTGLFHHDMFVSRNFAICLIGLFTEGMVYITFNSFYGEETAILFDSRPLFLGLRFNTFSLGQLVAYPVYGYIAYRWRSVKESMIFGFLCFVGAVGGLVGCGVDSNAAVIGLCFLAGVGFASPIALIASVVQLSVPPELIGAASALALMSRSVGGAVGVAIANAVFNSKIMSALPNYIAKAALSNGLPESSLSTFIEGLATDNVALASSAAGVTPQILAAGQKAYLEAFAHSFKYIWIVLLPFLILTLIAVASLKSVRKQMNQLIDRPVEKIHHRHHYEQH